MQAEKKSPALVARRPRRVTSALTRASTLLWASVCFAGLSACAGKPLPSPAEPPRYQISDTVRTGSNCDGLRGRLPNVDELDVGVALNGWEGAEAFGACQQSRAVAAIAAGDALTAAWEEYANARRR